MARCIVCQQNEVDWLICDNCKGNVIEKKELGSCCECKYSNEPKDDHMDMEDIVWKLCSKHGFDVVGYFYCKDFEVEQDE